MRNIRIAFGLSTIALVSLLASQPLLAQGNKKEPRASASAATVCSLDGSDFNVEVRVRDKTSGSAIAALTAWEISALAKTGTGNWTQQKEFGFKEVSGLALPLPATIQESFTLCVPDSTIIGKFVINPNIVDAKALNAAAKVTYGHVVDGPVVVDGTVMNMCGDDPDTLDVVEPSGIPLNA